MTHQMIEECLKTLLVTFIHSQQMSGNLRIGMASKAKTIRVNFLTKSGFEPFMG